MLETNDAIEPCNVMWIKLLSAWLRLKFIEDLMPAM